MESVLEKKNTRYFPHSAVPQERVVLIKIKIDRNLKVGSMWSPAVIDFYGEMFSDLIESGYTLQQIEDFYNLEDLNEDFGY